ncbi:hypothetical protein FN846DRAFT_921203 [Sphaerosporella brunnea]|uniref:Uncharacterized protein n=1 Tax=Sphaerosporella brunnea TaxID=1250544 RepID=A0A5J5EPY2_9PEZI|nr:hypothetical protein FN846DRAFT_921203 [Sphaerosporella brunnea]
MCQLNTKECRHCGKRITELGRRCGYTLNRAAECYRHRIVDPAPIPYDCGCVVTEAWERQQVLEQQRYARPRGRLAYDGRDLPPAVERDLRGYFGVGDDGRVIMSEPDYQWHDLSLALDDEAEGKFPPKPCDDFKITSRSSISCKLDRLEVWDSAKGSWVECSIDFDTVKLRLQMRPYTEMLKNIVAIGFIGSKKYMFSLATPLVALNIAYHHGCVSLVTKTPDFVDYGDKDEWSERFVRVREALEERIAREARYQRKQTYQVYVFRVHIPLGSQEVIEYLRDIAQHTWKYLEVPDIMAICNGITQHRDLTEINQRVQAAIEHIPNEKICPGCGEILASFAALIVHLGESHVCTIRCGDCYIDVHSVSTLHESHNRCTLICHICKEKGSWMGLQTHLMTGKNCREALRKRCLELQKQQGSSKGGRPRRVVEVRNRPVDQNRDRTDNERLPLDQELRRGAVTDRGRVALESRVNQPNTTQRAATGQRVGQQSSAQRAQRGRQSNTTQRAATGQRVGQQSPAQQAQRGQPTHPQIPAQQRETQRPQQPPVRGLAQITNMPDPVPNRGNNEPPTIRGVQALRGVVFRPGEPRPPGFQHYARRSRPLGFGRR